MSTSPAHPPLTLLCRAHTDDPRSPTRITTVRAPVDVNVLGSMLVAQQAALAMREAGKGGSIVLIASCVSPTPPPSRGSERERQVLTRQALLCLRPNRMSGTITNRGMHTPAYNTSKSAVLQLGRSLAVEFGVDKIRVNTLSPGYVQTAMTAALLEKEPALAKQWQNDNPLCAFRLPTPCSPSREGTRARADRPTPLPCASSPALVPVGVQGPGRLPRLGRVDLRASPLSLHLPCSASAR